MHWPFHWCFTLLPECYKEEKKKTFIIFLIIAPDLVKKCMQSTFPFVRWVKVHFTELVFKSLKEQKPQLSEHCVFKSVNPLSEQGEYISHLPQTGLCLVRCKTRWQFVNRKLEQETTTWALPIYAAQWRALLSFLSKALMFAPLANSKFTI